MYVRERAFSASLTEAIGVYELNLTLVPTKLHLYTP